MEPRDRRRLDRRRAGTHDDAMVTAKLPCARCGQETYHDPDWDRVGRRRYCGTCATIRRLEARVSRLAAAVAILVVGCFLLAWWAL